MLAYAGKKTHKTKQDTRYITWSIRIAYIIIYDIKNEIRVRPNTTP